MATFYEVKQLLGRLLGVRNMEDNDDDITVETRSFREPQESKQIVISNAELQELYNRVSAMNNNGLELYTGSHYEIAIDLDHPIMRRQEFPVISEDTANGVEYELNYPTVEYSFYLLIMIKDAMNQQQGRNNRIPPMRLRRPFDRHFNNDSDTSLDTILPRIIGELSLKIKNTNTISKVINKVSRPENGNGFFCYSIFLGSLG